MKTFGPLCAISSTGKIKIWQATATDDAILIVEHGYKDGKITTSQKPIKGKNIGKANETTDYEQCCFDAQSKMNKKIDEGYVSDIFQLKEQKLLLPMLALPYTKRKHDIKYPAIVQPKLDGVRCISNGKEFISRKGKPYTTLSHLEVNVKDMISKIGDVYLDGEIFNPNWNFQEVVRAVKNPKGDGANLQYWVYDIVDESLSYAERLNLLKLFKNEYDNIVIVDSYLVNNENEMKQKHTDFVAAGFEGTIIRNVSGKYKLKHRSKDLQKYKDFIDDEFKIVGGVEATGNDTGTVVFICETKDGKRFNVRPKGTREERAEWLKNIDNIFGLNLTVRYQNLSEDGVPIFPVGIAIRNYE